MNTDQEWVSLPTVERETGIPLRTLQNRARKGDFEGAKRRPRSLDDPAGTGQWVLPRATFDRLKAELDTPERQARQHFNRKRARLLRQRRGASQSETARAINGRVSAAQVRHWELGNSIPPAEVILSYENLLREWEQEMKPQRRRV